MDLRQTALGLVQLLVFIALQFGVLNALGQITWIVGVIVFAVVLWLIGQGVMGKKMPSELAELWQFATGLAIVGTVIVSLGYPMLGSMTAGVSMTTFTSWVLGSWLIVFGAAMFVTGWTAKWGVTTTVGVIWLFSAIYFITGAGAAGAYFYFALFTGLPFIIYGFITKR